MSAQALLKHNSRLRDNVVTDLSTPNSISRAFAAQGAQRDVAPKPLVVRRSTCLASNLSSRFSRIDKPCEDAIWDSDTVSVIADGTTRAPMVGESYPSPSPSAVAAKRFVRAVDSHMRSNHHLPKSTALIDAFVHGNQVVADVNRSRLLDTNLDYLNNDLAGVVAAAAVIEGDKLHYAQIGDANIYLYRDGKLIQLTDTQTDKSSDYRRSRGYKTGDKELDNQIRIEMRSEIRNNPSHPLSFGVMTGEQSALGFIRTGTIEIEPGDRFLIATDGLEKYLEHAVKQGGSIPELEAGDSPALVQAAINLNIERKSAGDDIAATIIAA